MNTLIMSIPISIFLLYGLSNLSTASPIANKQAKTGITSFNDGYWLAKVWILGIIILMLVISISGF
jgi:hypothetical protein